MGSMAGMTDRFGKEAPDPQARRHLLGRDHKLFAFSSPVFRRQWTSSVLHAVSRLGFQSACDKGTGPMTAMAWVVESWSFLVYAPGVDGLRGKTQPLGYIRWPLANHAATKSNNFGARHQNYGSRGAPGCSSVLGSQTIDWRYCIVI